MDKKLHTTTIEEFKKLIWLIPVTSAIVTILNGKSIADMLIAVTVSLVLGYVIILGLNYVLAKQNKETQ